MNPELILPRREIDFLVFDWLRAEALTRRPLYAGQSRHDFELVLDLYVRLAVEEFAPHNKANDVEEPSFDGRTVRVNEEVGVALRAFSDAGLVAAGLPAAGGGLGIPSLVERAGFAYLMAANPGTAGYALLTIANAGLLIAHASPEQIQRYVKPMIDGRYFGTMCLSEPQAGSSLADIRTRAVPVGDGRYRLFGNKMWISGGEHGLSENIIHLVLAKIPDPDGSLPVGVKGLSLMAVPRSLIDAQGRVGSRNDVVVAGINHKMGQRGTVNCLLNFGEGLFRPEGESGAIGEIIGAPGEGLACMFHMMNEARTSVGIGAAALAYTGYLHALEYARTRTQGRLRSAADPGRPPVPIVQHADVRRMLLAQKAYAGGALALCLYAARLSDDSRSLEDADARADAGLLLDLLTPIVKSWSSQWGVTANDLAIQVHGGYGYTRDYNVEQFYRDNRLNPIHEGTFGVQAIDLLGRKTRALGGASMKLLLDRLSETVGRARDAAGTVESLARHAQALDAARIRLAEITRRLHALSDDELRLANAAPYLEAFGHVVVAWLWLDQAVTIAALAGDLRRQDFHRGRLAACDYFFGWELPKISAWFAVLDPVELTPLRTPEHWL